MAGITPPVQDAPPGGPLVAVPKSVRQELWILRHWYILPLCLVGVFAAILVGSSDVPRLITPFLIILVAFCAVPFLTRHLRRNGEAAAIAFTTASPQFCRLEYARFQHFPNGDVYLIREAGASPVQPFCAASIRFRPKPILRRPVTAPVGIYWAPEPEAHFFGILSEKHSGWGERLTSESLQRGLQHLKRAYWATVSLLSVGVLGVLIMAAPLKAKALQAAQQADATTSWPTVEGRILEATVEEANANTFRVVAQYLYSVDGASYTGDRIRIEGSVMRTYAEASAYAASLTLGSAVSVAYNPQDPSQAVLEPGHGQVFRNKVKMLRSLQWLTFAGFVTGAVLLCILYRRTARQSTSLEHRLDELGNH